MFCWLRLVVGLARAIVKSRRDLLFENIALRHQLLVLSRKTKPTRLPPLDRALWVWLSLAWNRWTSVLRLVQPDTVVRWHRLGFRLFWRWKSRAGKPGRKRVAPETSNLIRQMSRANPLWGTPRIHGELLKLGIGVAQRTVAKYMLPHPPRSTSQTWTSFLGNHLGQTVSVDFLVVPTLRFHVLYVFLVLSHTRRQVLHFNITDAPSAGWTAQQLAVSVRDGGEQAEHLLLGGTVPGVSWLSGTKAIHRPEFLLENFAVEKQDRVEGLVLG